MSSTTVSSDSPPAEGAPCCLIVACWAAVPAAQRQAVGLIQRHPLQALIIGLGIGTLAWLVLRQDGQADPPVTP